MAAVAARSGDYAWIALGVSAAAYELVADDLLSEATDRYVAAHPWITRLIIAAIAGHLGGVIPPALDIFSARNVAHRWLVKRLPL